jgi:hypothetical protein
LPSAISGGRCSKIWLGRNSAAIDVGLERKRPWISLSRNNGIREGADDCAQFSDIVHSRDCIESFRPGFIMRGEQRSDGASAAPRRDDDDQIVPIAGSAFSSIKLIKKNSTLKPCNRLLYGMCSTHPEIITPGGEASSS